MSIDLLSLATDQVDDFEAEKILHTLIQAGDMAALKDACWTVLTAECFPPRPGATYAAVQQMELQPGWRAEFWSRLLDSAAIDSWSSAQLGNWISGHYYHAYQREDFERFVELAQTSTRDYDRRCIAVMLFTWRSYGEDEARVREFMDSMLQQA